MNPLTGEVADKESYVRDGGDGHAIGCGIYRPDQPGQTRRDKPRAEAWSGSEVRVLERMSA